MAEKILLAASGGVDSSVAAYLLLEQGYDVTGAVFIMSDAHLPVAEAAKKAAAEIGFPLHVLDLREEFRSRVILPFCADYASGRTPSPCVFCNPAVKFRALTALADSLGIRKVATGHYAKILSLPGGHAVAVADCVPRDQSYMLYRLEEAVLSRLVLPLEHLTKEEVREIGRARGFTGSEAPDSEENCFIPDNDYIRFLEKEGFRGPRGHLILPDGRNVPHDGIHRFTVGQRKGLGVSYSCPLYVKRIDPAGDVILCTAGGEYSSLLELERPVLSPCFSLRPGGEVRVKVRSAAKPVPAVIGEVSPERVVLRFPDPVRAAAPGQSAVFYLDGVIAGGGVISRAD